MPARGLGVTGIKPLIMNDNPNGVRVFAPTCLAASLLHVAAPRALAETVGCVTPSWKWARENQDNNLEWWSGFGQERTYRQDWNTDF